MICFDVYVNDKKLCRAGFQDAVVLTSILSWAKLTTGEEEMFFGVGGLYHPTSGGNAHPSWVEQLAIAAGDKITIEVVNAENPDEPVRETVESLELIKQQKRKYLEHMKGEFENDQN